MVAAASLQHIGRHFNRKVGFATSPHIKFLFDEHPYIEFLEGQAQVQLRWPSQVHNNIWGLHTSQRFSSQLGFFIDPTETLDVYRDGKLIQNSPDERLVCISKSSLEHTRRFLPERAEQIIVSESKNLGYDIEYIGGGHERSVKHIPTMFDLLQKCKLFVGIISFPYHLSATIRTPALVFFSYMPYYKFSHFIGTEHIYSQDSCVARCEEFETRERAARNCYSRCLATEYPDEEVTQKIRKMLT